MVMVFDVVREGRIAIIESSVHGCRCAHVRLMDGAWKQRADKTIVMNSATMGQMQRDGQFVLARDLPRGGR
ncbi:MAG TPA: hypothetical protein VG102_01050 [Candidatus Paceibacterota bacterium]|jgi:hypothetical protein|nr:hypothetical protein [Candidatus Paceibacterota bacterium]